MRLNGSSDFSVPRNVLIICQYFVPYAASVGGVARVVHLARYLKDQGYEVNILTSDGADFGDLGLGELLTGLDVTYLRDPLKRSIQNSLMRIGHHPAGSASVWLSRLRVVKRVVTSLVIPDLGLFMVSKYYRAAAALIESKGIDTLIVSTPPHSMQLVGGLLKRKFDDRLDLVADYRDSWNGSKIFSPKGVVTSMISRRLERFSLKRADLITFASQPMFAKLNRLFPDLPLESKGLLMMNGYAGEPWPVRGASESADLRIGHFGMANDDEKGYRNVEPLLRAIAGAIEAGITIRLCFYGSLRLSRIDLRDFPFVEVHASVGHAEVFTVMQEMHYLLILHTDPASSDEVITGKFFDYIKARRPILCFSPENTEAARLVKRWQVGEWLDSQAPERASQALSTLRPRCYPALLDDELVASFGRNGQYRKLYERLRGAA
ncbi:MAG: hypothetical protein IPJ27_09470 [Candidatus Accumulibacter sp.]|uniref:Glycosyltransferase subfamily 4-like N-terminal domain-containing protein n=1 Tax=Candidatus Accumulibacter proximus TaxID=2954385 RepID=A0A935PX37_9PROT|nr:hypothetical protein [Candidatus Accumulibacter proximus]